MFADVVAILAVRVDGGGGWLATESGRVIVEALDSWRKYRFRRGERLGGLTSSSSEISKTSRGRTIPEDEEVSRDKSRKGQFAMMREERR